MKSGPAVVFGMPQRGHFNRLRPLIAGLAGAGLPTYVLTDRRFRPEVERAGGRFVDLFAGRPIESADATSIPVPSRYVSFAGRYADDITREVAALHPSIVVYDTFAVIAVAVANHLGVPRVNVCAGHNLAPGPTLEALHQDPRVRLSEDCWRGVRSLRERYGISDASPFSYISALSPDLNVYCEPPEFLTAEERRPFEPIAFFGSLSPEMSNVEKTLESHGEDDSAGKLRIYVSFGTVIWSYYASHALRALEAFSAAVAERADTVALVSLGGAGAGTGEQAAKLMRANVRVEAYVDQHEALREASVCITHQGLNSTHEAIFCEVPMISYPFFSDQPGLARRCWELGLALPLVESLRAPVDPDDVRAALARIETERAAMRARLAEARQWELETIRARPSVIARILELAR